MCLKSVNWSWGEITRLTFKYIATGVPTSFDFPSCFDSSTAWACLVELSWKILCLTFDLLLLTTQAHSYSESSSMNYWTQRRIISVYTRHLLTTGRALDGRWIHLCKPPSSKRYPRTSSSPQPRRRSCNWSCQFGLLWDIDVGYLYFWVLSPCLCSALSLSSLNFWDRAWAPRCY